MRLELESVPSDFRPAHQASQPPSIGSTTPWI
jgi:hypothetical protein